MSVTDVVIRSSKKQVGENDYRNYLYGSDASLVTALDKDGNPTTVQEFINNSGGGGEGGDAEVDIDLQNALPKVKSSEINGDINVNGEDISVYDEQYIQGKANADAQFTYEKSGNTLEFNYYVDESDVLAGFPAPPPSTSGNNSNSGYDSGYSSGGYGDSGYGGGGYDSGYGGGGYGYGYGGGQPVNPLSLSDERPCRLSFKPYFCYDGGYGKTWAGGQGKNKGRFTMLEAIRLEYGMNPLFVVDPLQKIIKGFYASDLDELPEFDIVISQPSMSDYLVDGQKYILNGIPEEENNIKFVLRYDDEEPTENDKEGKNIVFTYSDIDGPLSVHLVGTEASTYSPELINQKGIKPMIRLASEFDGSFEPYENEGSVSGSSTEIVLKQENYNLSDGKKATEDKYYNIIPITNNIHGDNYDYGWDIGGEYISGPDGYSYERIYHQKLLCDDGVIYLRCYAGNKCLIVDTKDGIKGIYYSNSVSYDDTHYRYGSCYEVNIYNGNSGDFYFEYSTDGENYTHYQGSNPPVSFISRMAVDEDYESLESDLTFCYNDESYKTLLYGGIYWSIYDLGLYSIYNRTSCIYSSYDPDEDALYDVPAYFSSYDGYIDRNNWKFPTKGSFVVTLSQYDEESEEYYESYNSVSYPGKLDMNFYKDTKVKLTVYEIWHNDSNLNLVGNNGIDIVFTCKPGMALSRDTYKNTLTEDYPVCKGNSSNFDLVDYSTPSAKNSAIQVFPDKKVSAKQFKLDYMPLTLPADGTPCGWDQYSELTNDFDFSSDSSYVSPSGDCLFSYFIDDNMDKYSFVLRDTPSKRVLIFTSNFQLSGSNFVVGIRAECPDYPNLIFNRDFCYGFLSSSSNPTSSNSIIFDINSNIGPVLDSAMYNNKNYFGVVFDASKVPLDTSIYWHNIYFYPIVCYAKEYIYLDPYGSTQSVYASVQDISNRFPINADSSNLREASINYIVPQNFSVKGYKISDLTNDTPILNTTIDLSGIDFYSIHCPYDNNNYKYYYYCIPKPKADGYYYNREYSKLTEIWSNYPLVGLTVAWFNSICRYDAEDSSVWKQAKLQETGIYIHYDGEDSQYAATEIGISSSQDAITNIPFFESTANAVTYYASTMVSNANNNQVWGLAIDFKKKKIIKTFDFMGTIEDYNYNTDFTAQEWYGTQADWRYDAVPQSDSGLYVFRTDTFKYGNEIRETPCQWDIDITGFDIKNLIIPQSPTDDDAIVKISAGDISSSDPKAPNIEIRYTTTPFAFNSDLDEVSARVDALQSMIISSLNGTY